MDKMLFGKLLVSLLFLLPAPAVAAVNVDVNISLPPPIVFAAPPALVVLPETYVYFIPDAEVEIFFYNGWWWRPWEGQWYRSRHYDSGWRHYRSAPSFYGRIPSGWRDDYRDHRWRGHQWDYQRIPHHQVQQNWNNWEKNKHWEKQNTWGVRGLKPQTQAQQPSRAVQQKAQKTKPEVREVQPQQPRSQSQPKPEVREKARPQQSAPPSREVKQQSREIQSQQSRTQSQPKPQMQPKPEVRERARPQQSAPPSREVREQQSRPQQHELQQKSKPQRGGSERAQEEKQDRK